MERPKHLGLEGTPPADELDVEQVSMVFSRQVRKTTREPFAAGSSRPGPKSAWTSPTSTPGSSSTSFSGAEGRSAVCRRVFATWTCCSRIGPSVSTRGGACGPPPPASPRAAGQDAAGQSPSSYDRACRPGLCHRVRSVRADLTALRKGGPTNRSTSLRGSTRHGLGRRARRHGPRRLRLQAAVFYTKVHDRILSPVLSPDPRTLGAPSRHRDHRPRHRGLRRRRAPEACGCRPFLTVRPKDTGTDTGSTGSSGLRFLAARRSGSASKRTRQRSEQK
jgi:hypothetical protein